MFTHPTHVPTHALTRRAALMGTAALLALPGSRLFAAPASTDVWPNALQVPGGIARLSLGPAAARPVAYAAIAGDVPLDRKSVV